tara:strand:+ start:6169 stop:6402 length:234 start_codon:yes stop_codon:yes gene_type:complete
MKKNEWLYLASAMWRYSEQHNGKLSALLKELIILINKNMEMIIDDNETISKNAGSKREHDPNTSNNIPFEGTGEFRR